MACVKYIRDMLTCCFDLIVLIALLSVSFVTCLHCFALCDRFVLAFACLSSAGVSGWLLLRTRFGRSAATGRGMWHIVARNVVAVRGG